MGGQKGQFDLTARGPYSDKSGRITAGGVSQKLLSASDNWNDVFVQNPSDQSESLFVDFGVPAAVPATPTSARTAIELMPGQYIYKRTPGYIPSDQWNITAATINHPFVCKAN